MFTKTYTARNRWVYNSLLKVTEDQIKQRLQQMVTTGKRRWGVRKTVQTEWGWEKKAWHKPEFFLLAPGWGGGVYDVFVARLTGFLRRVCLGLAAQALTGTSYRRQEALVTRTPGGIVLSTCECKISWLSHVLYIKHDTKYTVWDFQLNHIKDWY